jgi:PrtD family type I secretion system ABC transporter
MPRRSALKSTNPIAIAISACRSHLVLAALFSALLNLLYLVPSLYMLQVYDRVVPTRGVTTLAMLTLIFIVAIITLNGLDYLRSRLLVRASTRLDRLLSGEVLSALFRTGMNRNRSSAALREFDILRQTLTGSAILAVLDAPWTPIYVLVCFLLHPALGAMALIGSALLLLLSWLNEKATREPLKQANLTANLSYMSIDSSLAAAGTVRALGMRRALIAHHLREREDSLIAQARASFASAQYVSLIKALRLMLGSLALGLGALLAVEQAISPGAIFAASLLITRALAPIEQVSGAWKSMIQARGAYAMLTELFDDSGVEWERTELPEPTGRITVENIQLVSPDRDRMILRDIAFELEPGEMLGIIGASGAGKSSLAQIIAGAQEATAGVVRLDGANLADWPEDQLRDCMAYVPQELSLLRGTIKENISRFFRPADELAAKANDARVIRAAQLSGAHDFILNLPHAYETPLGWNGKGLSVGQLQRVAFARALYVMPRVLVLDEPNSALDPKGEARLEATLNQLREQKVTLIIVAHRINILGRADKLLVLDEGRITHFGRREEILPLLMRPVERRPVAGTN